MLGNRIYNSTVKDENFKINTTAFQYGIYCYQLTDESGIVRYSGKFIKE